jgi:hypothetical protein
MRDAPGWPGIAISWTSSALYKRCGSLCENTRSGIPDGSPGDRPGRHLEDVEIGRIVGDVESPLVECGAADLFPVVLHEPKLLQHAAADACAVVAGGAAEPDELLQPRRGGRR